MDFIGRLSHELLMIFRNVCICLYMHAHCNTVDSPVSGHPWESEKVSLSGVVRLWE